MLLTCYSVLVRLTNWPLFNISQNFHSIRCNLSLIFNEIPMQKHSVQAIILTWLTTSSDTFCVWIIFAVYLLLLPDYLCSDWCLICWWYNTCDIIDDWVHIFNTDINLYTNVFIEWVSHHTWAHLLESCWTLYCYYLPIEARQIVLVWSSLHWLTVVDQSHSNWTICSIITDILAVTAK